MRKVTTYCVTVFLMVFILASGSGLNIGIKNCLCCHEQTVYLNIDDTTCDTCTHLIDEQLSISPLCCTHNEIELEISFSTTPPEKISVEFSQFELVSKVIKSSWSYENTDKQVQNYDNPDANPGKPIIQYLCRARNKTLDNDDAFSIA